MGDHKVEPDNVVSRAATDNSRRQPSTGVAFSKGIDGRRDRSGLLHVADRAVAVILWPVSNTPTQITEDQVRHVAKLSRLRLRDDEVHHFAEQLSHVMGYIAKINELDLEGVEPMSHPLDMTNVLREDVEQSGLPVETALANAPQAEPPYFEVPKVLGEGSGA